MTSVSYREYPTYISVGVELPRQVGPPLFIEKGRGPTPFEAVKDWQRRGKNGRK